MKPITILLLLSILLACNHPKSETDEDILKTERFEESVVEGIEEAIGEATEGDIDTELVEEIEVLLPVPEFEDFIPFCETFGGSYLPKKYLYRPEEKGYFGAHHLYDREKHVQMGFLIAHNTVDEFHQWKFSDTTQVFIVLVLKKGGSRLKLFNQIGILDTRADLIKCLGEPQIETDSMIVYWDEERTIGQFKMEKGRIQEINYGRYNERIHLPLTQEELNKINDW